MLAELETVPAIAEPQPARRILLLSGEWRMPGSAFHLEATIFAAADGSAEGEICWSNVDTAWIPTDFVGSELVRGRLAGMSLDIQGYCADTLLVCDRYAIDLYGATEAGLFVGVSDVSGTRVGRMSGTYRTVDQRG